ncbi:MAG: GTPase HflX [Actinomycetota bacterium]
MALKLPNDRLSDIEESLRELEQLAITAGAEVVDKIIQERDKPHPRTFIGPGKAQEIQNVANNLGVNLVPFNHDLSPSQQRNLEDIISCKILDRTALILDIFAQRAHSREGALQVELAQGVYLLPRLKGRGIELSRLGGGIGTRGPGETKLEVDRRRIQQRISHLRKDLEHIRKSRLTQRKKRKKTGVFTVSMVGYTNAGKSTLLNTLTHADVFVENKLFATLDPTTRRLVLPNKQTVVISDIVGFIKNLPHQLIAAFGSTLDSIREADLLLHIVDVSHPNFREQMKAVEEVMSEIGVAEKNRVNLFNKVDRVSEIEIARLKREFPKGIFVSALKGENIEDLINEIKDRASKGLIRVHLYIPVDKRRLLERIYANGAVVQEREFSHGVSLVVDLPRYMLSEVEELQKAK